MVGFVLLVAQGANAWSRTDLNPGTVYPDHPVTNGPLALYRLELETQIAASDERWLNLTPQWKLIILRIAISTCQDQRHYPCCDQYGFLRCNFEFHSCAPLGCFDGFRRWHGGII